MQAAEWYRRAADQGDAVAQHNLGTMYLDGEGVEENMAQVALRGSAVAAEQDYPPAQFSLGECVRGGARGVEEDMKRALFWYNKAAEFGDPEAEEKLRELSDETQ